jgi:hypothetical protein
MADVTSNERAVSERKEYIRSHIETPQLKFFVELAPYSKSGAICQHPTCVEKIKPDSYRVAMYPGLPRWDYGTQAGKLYHVKLLNGNYILTTLDFYHIQCFEDLVDFSQASYLDLITPVTRNTVKSRELKNPRNYLLDGGAERLILEWKVVMRRLIDERDGVPIQPMDGDLNDLYRKSGSASYELKQIKGIPFQEFYNLATMLAPIESDGVEDTEEWNLFEQYIGLDRIEDLNYPHSLSDMLKVWEFDMVMYPHSMCNIFYSRII